ncbi:MAG: hypothetical protein A2W01_02120 [Candidatus Solincola sediminis]|nr:MAG: hypothetical protein A2W01_02120 [Candidatus Solincola sediminis]
MPQTATGFQDQRSFGQGTELVQERIMIMSVKRTGAPGFVQIEIVGRFLAVMAALGCLEA